MSDEEASQVRAIRGTSGSDSTEHVRAVECPTDDRWLRRAACRGADLRLFFPEARQSPSAEAKAFCAACSVSAECLEYAIENRLSGVWGGTSETQRSLMRKMRRAS